MDLDLSADTAAPRVALGSGLDALPTELHRLVLTLDLADASGEGLGRCVEDLLHLSDNTLRVEQLSAGLYFAFNGLDRDPRQVHSIPECRDMLRALHQRWPYWMHFLAPVPELWTVLLLCLLPLGPGVRLPNGRIGHELDRKALKNLMLDLSNALNDLHEQHKVPLASRQRIFKAAMHAIEQATGARL
jgi:hypothetical protein